MDLSQLTSLFEHAQASRQQMDETLATTVVEGSSGGGAVSVRMNGRKELLALTIAPAAATSAAGDITMLEDLILAAIHEAHRKAEVAEQASAASLLGGLNLPSL